MNVRHRPARSALPTIGMISSTGGIWTFTPDSDLVDEIMVDLPDADHLYFGWWLKEPDDAEGTYAFRTFSGGTVPFSVGNKFTSGNNDELHGTASYEGRAAGQYVTKDFSGGVLSGGRAGVFTATASLTANFGGNDIAVNDQFNIRGSVSEFRDVERNRALEGWSVTAEQGRSCTAQRILSAELLATPPPRRLAAPPARGPGRAPSSTTTGPIASPALLPVCSTLIYPPRILPVASAPPTWPRMNKESERWQVR